MTHPSAPYEVEFPVRLARVLLVIAGLLLLFESLLGMDYALEIGFSSLREILTDLCLTMAFPVYLIGLFSLRGATASLWVFFIVQWINICFSSSHPGYVFVNPFSWLHGDFSFFSAIMVSISTWMLRRPQDGIAHVNMRTVFD
jgi:hypothetical protein